MALLSAVLLAQGPAAFAQQGVAWLTEGKVFLVRGAATYAAVDGAKALEGDIFSAEAKSQVQLALPGGTIVNTGPATRFMVVSAPAKGAAELALMGGWLKVGQMAGAPGLRISTPGAQASFEGATAVVFAAAGVLQVFVESGSMTIVESGEKGTAGSARKVKAGEFFSSHNLRAAVQPRPAKEFIEAMPRHFRDPLPALPDKVRDRKVEPKRDHDVTYDEVADWLKTSMAVRKGFVKRFLPRAKDAQFRAGLAAHVREHPEWDRVLFPEKYETKDASQASGADVKPAQASGGKKP